MDLNTYFTDFLAEIRLPDEYAEECREEHQLLRQRLLDDPNLSPIIVSTFLQGSYKRGTVITPNHEQRADVDVVLVSKLSKEEYMPNKVFPVFTPFLEEHYREKYRFQGRSIGISLEHVDLDMVITAAPSESEFGILKSESLVGYATLEESEDWQLDPNWLPAPQRQRKPVHAQRGTNGSNEWKSEPLWIPDREARTWERTDPLAQIKWTKDKNGKCNGHYLGVVKAIKWWHRRQLGLPKHPKGYLIEHLVGVACPDGIRSVAEGVTRTLEEISLLYQDDAAVLCTPYLEDHGVPEHNVFKRVSGVDFAAFHSSAVQASRMAREAFDSADVTQSATGWQQLFGEEFPDPPPNSERGGKGPAKESFTPRTGPSIVGGGRFA